MVSMLDRLPIDDGEGLRFFAEHARQALDRRFGQPAPGYAEACGLLGVTA